MFGNAFLDYCFVNFDNLVKIATDNVDYVVGQLSAEAKVFVKYYQLIMKRKGTLIPFSDFTAIGIDMQSICFLSFLVSFKQGNTKMSIGAPGVTYTP
jgi:hypothetical protein